MFFFIGGVGPRTIALDRQPRMCPHCGCLGLVLKRTDHYASLFFIPLFPVKKGKPFLTCESCGTVCDEHGDRRLWDRPSEKHVCRNCGRRIDPDFTYCPSCGNQVI